MKVSMCGRVAPLLGYFDKGSRAYDGGTCLALTLRISFFFVHKPKCPAGNNENLIHGRETNSTEHLLGGF